MTTNRFSDRDLMMRFRGGGVGHKATREATDFFRKDCDRLDMQAIEPSDDDVEENAEEVALNHESGAEDVSDEEHDYGYVRTDTEDSEEDSEEEGTDEDFGYADL